jgi:phage tail protein X
MKKQMIALVVPAVAGFFTVGCSSLQIASDPDTFTLRHEEWYAAVRANYPGWRPDSLVQVQSAPLRPVISYGHAKPAEPIETPTTNEPVPETAPPEAIPVPEDVVQPVPPVEKPVETPEKPVAEVPALVPVSTYVVKNGDTLTGISLATYGTSRHWQKILEANPSIKDAKRLRYGMKITLPALPGRAAAAKPAAEAKTPEAPELAVPDVPVEPTDTDPVSEPAPAPAATPAATPVATPATTPTTAIPAPAPAPAAVPVAKSAVPAPVSVPPAAAKAAAPAPVKTTVPAPLPAPKSKSI